MKTLYTAEALASGEGRDGTAVSNDGKLELHLASPVELGGDGEGTNPEQLFAAGYAACFHCALRLVGREEGRRHRLRRDRRGQHRRPRATATASAWPSRSSRTARRGPGPAEALVDQAHQVCPYSNATRGNIPVDITILEVAA